jgi:hypothetical protein
MLGTGEKECSYITACAYACECLHARVWSISYFHVVLMLLTKSVQGAEYMLVSYTKHDNLTLVKQIALCIYLQWLFCKDYWCIF